MKKEDIKHILLIVFAISAVSLFTSVIMHFVFLEEFASYHWGGYGAYYYNTLPNFISCTVFSLLSTATLISMIFFKFIKNTKVKKVLTILSLICVLIFNLIACCVAKFTYIYGSFKNENLTIMLTTAISCAILVIAIFGILYLNKNKNSQNKEQ